MHYCIHFRHFLNIKMNYKKIFQYKQNLFGSNCAINNISCWTRLEEIWKIWALSYVDGHKIYIFYYAARNMNLMTCILILMEFWVDPVSSHSDGHQSPFMLYVQRSYWHEMDNQQATSVEFRSNTKTKMNCGWLNSGRKYRGSSKYCPL